MLKKIVLVLAAATVLAAGDLTLDAAKSEVFYEAKKDMFFGTYTVIGVNRLYFNQVKNLR